MTASQIYQLIRSNSCIYVVLLDFSGKKLHTVDETNPEAAILSLERDIDKFSGYRKIRVSAKTSNKSNNDSAWVWDLEFPAQSENQQNVSVSAASGDSKYIGLLEKYFDREREGDKEKLELHKKMLELEYKMKQNSPDTWLPLIREVGPALGFTLGVAGPPGARAAEQTRELRLVGEDGNKLTTEQVVDRVQDQLAQLAGKISAPKVLQVVAALNTMDKIEDSIDKIILLLDKMKEKPKLLDMAVTFVQ